MAGVDGAMLELGIIALLMIVLLLLLCFIAHRGQPVRRCCRCGDPRHCPLRQGIGSSLSAGK